MTEYPHVLSEHETLRRVVAGASLARFGDGELRQAAYACDIKPQVADRKLTARLAEILRDSGDCMVGIPNIHVPGPKATHWNTYKQFCRLLVNREYASAFITRPDSAPWINEEPYWLMLESLWRGLEVTLVRGAQKSFTKDDLMRAGAKSVREILCKPNDAWQDYKQIMRDVGTPDHRVLICLGPTATVMAVDLCAKGVHAIDLGHAGLFWKKRERGLPMWVDKTDKAAK